MFYLLNEALNRSAFKKQLYAYIGLFILFAISILSSTSYGYEFGGVKVNGFVNQGFLSSSGNNYLGETKKGSFDFGEAGINFHYEASDRVFLSTQIVSRNITDFHQSEDDLRLEYGLLSYTPFVTDFSETQMKFGRIKAPLGFYNDVRSIVDSKPSVLLPQAMYFDYLRHGYLIDGYQLSNRFHLGDIGDIKFEFSQGKYSEPSAILQNQYDGMRDLINSLFGFDVAITGKKGSISNTETVRIFYYSPDGSFTFGISGSTPQRMYSKITNQFGNYSRLIENRVEIASLEYNWNRFTFIAEGGQVHGFNTDTLTSNQLGVVAEAYAEEKSISYYIHAKYQYLDNLSFYIQYQRYKRRVDYSEDVAPTIPYYRYHKEWSIGTTWNISDNFTLQSDFHVIDGAALIEMSSSFDDYNTGVYDRYWNMFALQLSYSF